MNASPSCFGMVSTISHLSETCCACECATACARTAATWLQSLPDSVPVMRERERIAVTRQALASAPVAGQVVGTVQRAPLSADQQAAIGGIGQAVASLARRLFETGWFEFARQELAAGRNPGKKDWQRIFCEGLLAGGISRQGLQLAYQEQLGLTPGSARVRVSKAVSVFLVGGLATEVSGLLQIGSKNQP